MPHVQTYQGENRSKERSGRKRLEEGFEEREEDEATLGRGNGGGRGKGMREEGWSESGGAIFRDRGRDKERDWDE